MTTEYTPFTGTLVEEPALSYAQLMGLWIRAGGPAARANIAAAIAYAESGGIPNRIQEGQPYSSTGWGLWQITDGSSAPTIGVDKQLFDPLTNARAAVQKYDDSVQRGLDGFEPWTTYTYNRYEPFLQSGVTPSDAGITSGGSSNPVQLPLPADSGDWTDIAVDAFDNAALSSQKAQQHANAIGSYVGAIQYVTTTGPEFPKAARDVLTDTSYDTLGVKPVTDKYQTIFGNDADQAKWWGTVASQPPVSNPTPVQSIPAGTAPPPPAPPAPQPVTIIAGIADTSPPVTPSPVPIITEQWTMPTVPSYYATSPAGQNPYVAPAYVDNSTVQSLPLDTFVDIVAGKTRKTTTKKTGKGKGK